jgi:AAT family amino acid transporter
MTEYWLASLKVATIVVFIILGIVVNAGGNTSHEYIGGKNWRVGDAPFVGGFGGFARVFVTASFACECQKHFTRAWFSGLLCARIDGGTESLGITAGETKNPSKNMPRVVKAVFWR